MTLTPTHLNISSVVGPMSMELLPPPGSPIPGGGLFQRLRASTLSEWGAKNGAGNPVAEAKRADPKYPFCDLRPHGMELTLIEYAAFSFLAYLEKDSPSFRTFFEAAFDPEEWTIVRGPEPRSHGAVFLDAFNKRLNTSVVATRGTNPKNLFDVFQDMILFTNTFLWDAVGQVRTPIDRSPLYFVHTTPTTPTPDRSAQHHNSWCPSSAGSLGRGRATSSTSPTCPYSSASRYCVGVVCDDLID